jgi:response regulator RpfG family c-di-GMP phosphodiesterase
MNGKILFVDDEPEVLQAYKRILHGDFQVSTAISGEDAMGQIGKNGRFEVIVSDMQMPGMNGIQLLARVREIAPQTIRVVLTGHADIETAMNAVNEGAVFRFLTKPCPASVLKKTLTACLLQYHLINAEKELLENTLMGAIKVLTDVLSLASPAAFGRSLRINHYVQHMVRELRLEMPWRYEAAAMLSQLGCITLEPELLQAAYCAEPMAAEEQVHFNMHPAVARDLLANIPRLEGIAWIIGQQLGAAYSDQNVSDSIKMGAEILQIAVAFDKLKGQGCGDVQAVAELQASHKFDVKVLQALRGLQPVIPAMESRLVEVSNLEPGMIVDEEVRSTIGLLLAGKGQEITYPLVMRLRNFHRRRLIQDKVAVLVARDSRSANQMQATAQ